jgi:hypothetical protein
MQVEDDHISECQLLLLSSLFQASLHHTAAMLVRADLNAILHACFKDELGEALKSFATLDIGLLRVLRCLKDTEEGLYHVISVSVLKRC